MFWVSLMLVFAQVAHAFDACVAHLEPASSLAMKVSVPCSAGHNCELCASIPCEDICGAVSDLATRAPSSVSLIAPPLILVDAPFIASPIPAPETSVVALCNEYNSDVPPLRSQYLAPQLSVVARLLSRFNLALALANVRFRASAKTEILDSKPKKENPLSPRFLAPSVLFAAFYCAIPASAQTAATSPDSSVAVPENQTPVALDELIARALQLNPQTQIAAAQTEAARARANSARAQIGPTLQLVPAIGGDDNSREESILLSQPIDLFGQRRANRAVADAQLRGVLSQRDVSTRALIIAVKTAAAELFAAQEAQSLGEVQLDIATQFRDAAARRAQLGEVPAVQAQRAQLELDRAAIELDAARAQNALRRVKLNQLIGAPPQAPLVVSLPEVSVAFGLAGFASFSDLAPSASSSSPANTNLASPTVPDSAQVGADLIATRAALLPNALQRPDILSVQSVVDVARAQANAIAAQRRPQLEIQARRGGVFRSAETSLRAVLTIPLFDLGESRNQQRAAQFEAQAGEKQLELLRSQVAAQLESALISLDQSRSLVARYRDSIVPQTLDLLRKTQIGYAAGASTYLEVLEAQRAAKQVQTEYLQALAGVRTGEADLESALGTDYILPAGAVNNPDSLDAPPGVVAAGTVPSE